MHAITYKKARDVLISELDRVNHDHDVTIITRHEGGACVLMSIKGYMSLLEQAHMKDRFDEVQLLRKSLVPSQQYRTYANV